MGDDDLRNWVADMCGRYPQMSGGASTDPQVCEDDGPNMSVQPAEPEPAPAPAEPAPQCGGDELGENQDRPVEVPTPGMGGAPQAFDDSKVTFNASGKMWIGGRATSESDFPGGQSGTVAISPGQAGQVRVDVRVEYFEDNMVINDTFRQDFHVTWNVAADADGRLTIDSPAPDVGAQRGGTWMRFDSINPASGASHVQVSPKVVFGAVSGGLSLGVGVQTAAAASFVQKTFRLNINVC